MISRHNYQVIGQQHLPSGNFQAARVELGFGIMWSQFNTFYTEI